jgi:hypothetical protein
MSDLVLTTGLINQPATQVGRKKSHKDRHAGNLKELGNSVC